MTGRLLGYFLVGLAALSGALSGALAEGQTAPSINASWATTGSNGGALNVNITHLPPNATVEVEVKDVSHSQVENPVGSPPAKADTPSVRKHSRRFIEFAIDALLITGRSTCGHVAA